MKSIANLETTLALETRSERHNSRLSPERRFDACVEHAAAEVANAAGYPTVDWAHVGWLSDGYPGDYEYLFAVTLWPKDDDLAPLTVHVTAHHDEVMFFFIPEDYEDMFPPAAA